MEKVLCRVQVVVKSKLQSWVWGNTVAPCRKLTLGSAASYETAPTGGVCLRSHFTEDRKGSLQRKRKKQRITNLFTKVKALE